MPRDTLIARSKDQLGERSHPLVRHDLVVLTHPEALLTAAAEHGQAVLALANDWQRERWPFVVAQQSGVTAGRVRLGWPLPATHGRLRIAFEVARQHVRRVVSPRLSELTHALLDRERRILQALMASDHRAEWRAYGSLLWQCLTGLPYRHAASDIDLLVVPSEETHLAELLERMTIADDGLDGRLDGELQWGAASWVSWRELARVPKNGLVLTRGMRAARLISRDDILVRPAVQAIASQAPRPGAVEQLATHALLTELQLHPKPGLVSFDGNGSHTDMSASQFVASIHAIVPFIESAYRAGQRSCGFSSLQQIGRDAEAAMLAATGGVNTHRGAIFALVLIAAAHAHWQSRSATDAPASHGDIIATRWSRDLAAKPVDANSHGQVACRRFGVTGALGEAQAGYPSIYRYALPTLREARACGASRAAALLTTFFKLLAHVDDTNVIHRGGIHTLRELQAAANELCIAGAWQNPHWQASVEALNTRCCALGVSAGGAADLLAATLFIDLLESCPR